MKRLRAVLLVFGAVVPFVLAGMRPALFNGWYPQWSRFISDLLARITSAVPFPVAELLSYTAPVAFIVYWFVSYRKRRNFRHALDVTLVWAGVSAAAVVWFWSLNYFCVTPSARMGLEPSPAAFEDLLKTAGYYRDNLNAAYVTTENDFDGLAEAVVQGFNKLSGEYDFILSNPVKPKRLVLGIVQSYLGITGIYIPFTGESCVVGDTPPTNLPVTMAHELAHRQGAAPEDEANFIGIMACLASDDPRVRYSGWFVAFIHLSNAVYAQSAEADLELMYGLDERVIDDIIALSAHYKKYEGPVNDAGEAINDAYLKTMQQPEGVKSYGMVADLLIAQYKRQSGE